MIYYLHPKSAKGGIAVIIDDSSRYHQRIVDKQVERYLRNFAAVCVEGPKWCGKTWTSAFHCHSEFLVGSPDNAFANRKLAELYPSTVLQGDTPRLIDEWQEVPSLWDAVRYAADAGGSKGQFVLTGSSTPKLKGIMHSGAGRIGRLHMHTMSLYESGDSSGVVSLKDICDSREVSAMTGEVHLEDLIYYIVRGGWPGNLGVSAADAQLLPSAYISSILEDDIYRMDDTHYDRHKVRLLLKSLARNESTTATVSKLLSDIQSTDGENVDRNTLAQYLDVLDRLFLIDNQPPFANNIRSSVRLKQSAKRHLCDPALACALLTATPDRLLSDLNTLGLLFEALCVRDLRIYAESMDASLYHYQDYRNKEIDAVIETADGRWHAFEIKLGCGQIDAAAKGLVQLRDSIAHEEGIAPSTLCVICGLSNAAYIRPDGVYVVPITALKP